MAGALLRLGVRASDRERVEQHLHVRGWVFGQTIATRVMEEKALRGVELFDDPHANSPLQTLYRELGLDESRAHTPLRDAHLGQHWLMDASHLRSHLGAWKLERVVEIGVGTATLTREILRAKPKHLVGIELDESVVPEDVRTQIELLIGDAREHLHRCAGATLICAPPYSLLGAIREVIAQCTNVLVMVPAKRESEFPSLSRVVRLDGDAFTPASEGAHLWLSS